MRKPRLTVASVMALVALAALNFAGIRAWLYYRVGHGVSPHGVQMTYIDNTYDLMGYGGLPMADLLAAGLLARSFGVTRRPFLLGLMAFGAAALVAFVACAALYTEGVIQPFILWVLRSLPRSIKTLRPSVRTSILYAIAASLVVLPQLAVAVLGGAIFQALSSRRRFG
jgi:hypothetical protein